MSVDIERLLDSVRQVESGGNTKAVSPKGAQGPYQFMPATAEQYGVKDPFDENQARDGARRYMSDLIQQNGGDVRRALVAWNWGPGNLQKKGMQNMPTESRNFLSKVMSHYGTTTAAQNFSADDLFPANQPASPLDTLFPGQGVRAAATGDLFPLNHDNDALRNSVLQAHGSADTASRVYAMQLRTGLPAAVIERNLDEIEARAKREDFDPAAFRKESPLLASWLAENPQRALLAKEDYENLGVLEKGWSTLKAVPAGASVGMKQYRHLILNANAAMGTITPQEELEMRQLKSELDVMNQEYATGLPSWFKAASEIVGLQVPMLAESARVGITYGLPTGAAAGAAIGAAGGTAGGPLAPATVPAGTLAGAAAGGVLGLKMGAGTSYIEQSYRLAMGEAYSDLSNHVDVDGHKIDPTVARYASQIVALPNALLEFASMRSAVKLIPGSEKIIGAFTTNQLKQILVRPTVRAKLAEFAKNYAGAVAMETSTEAMQKFLTIITGEVASGDMGEGLGMEDAQAVGAEAAQAFKGTAVLGALASGPKVIELMHDVKKAEQNQAFMMELGNITSQSSTLQKSPEAFRSYIEKLKQDGPIQNVFVPVEKWNLLFQDKAPAAAKEVFGNLDQYAEANVRGGDLVIPVELYAEKLAPTEFHQQLIPHSRLAPGELTPAEAAEVVQANPELTAKLEMELMEAQVKEAPLAAVYQDVYTKLKNVGMSNQEATRDAMLWREHVRARAERLGVDPLQLYQERPLEIQREYPGELASRLEAYNQQLVEPAVPTPQRLPLEGGEINLPPATEVEQNAASTALAAAKQSEQDYGVFGATVHPQRGNLAGTDGVAVAGYPQRGVITEGAPSKADIETFMRRNRDIFEGDKNAAVGIWVDNESGKGYLDITNVLPRDMAIAQGEQLGEIAVWDLGAGQEIRLGGRVTDDQQTLFQGERGASIPAKNLIALLKNADPSTFLHESGHLWLEELRQDALRPDAPAAVKADWETIKAWSGATDEAISTEAHEMFARGIESYVMEGKSPSFQLREAFAQFKDWLVRIYKTMSSLNVELTQDVRDVMDRLLATDEAISFLNERNTYSKLMFDRDMMTEQEYATYLALNETAKRVAEEHFRAKVMRELKREHLDAWRQEKAELTPKVRDEFLQVPIYKAAYWLYNGALPDGTTFEDVPTMKLDTQALLDMGVSLKDLAFRHQKGGLHPDVVAEMFGFTSGESFVRELIDLTPLREAVDEEVTRRMKADHGDLIQDGHFMDQAGLEVHNTKQLEVFGMELRILKRLGARQEATHPALLKDLARQIVGRQKIGQLDPRLFEASALQAAQNADEAMLSGDLDAAFDAKQKQMLNVYLYRDSMQKVMDIEKHVRKWKKFLARSDKRLAPYYNMDMVNAARAIVAAHGIGGTPETAASYMKQLASYDPQSYNDLKDIVEMASSDGRRIDDLTVDDFGIVADAVDGLWAMARRSRQIEIDGKKLERSQVVGELGGRIDEITGGQRKRAGYDRSVSTWDKTKMGFAGLRAMLRRVEHWVDAMDDGKMGVFRRYVWQPISEAADSYRDNRRLMLEKYMELTKSVPVKTFRQGKIDAREIGYEFANKTELIGALLHTGNESNLQKLLRGRQWGGFTPDGNLDSTRWDTFIARMISEGVITKSDYDFVQGVWNLLEEVKPMAQKAHKEMYGYFFSEVTARPINTPFGVYEGGYYPAIVDTYIVEDAAIRAEQESLEGRPSSFMFPTTGRGFTRQRAEAYAKPLSLDLGLIPQHLEKVLRFIHIEPHVKDVGRVMVDREFRERLAGLDSEVATVMLMPWLQRSALQLVEQPSGPRMRQFDAFFHAVRRNTGLQIMALNASVALQQLTGISLAAVKVKPRYLAGATWHFMRHPIEFSESIKASSSFMRNRISTQMMDIKRAVDEIVLDPTPYQKAKEFATRHAYFMQTWMQSFVDQVTWGGAYEQAMKDGLTEKDAIRMADSAVRETQGTFSAEDISRFEAGPSYLRLFTMFYSFFNMSANLNVTEFTKALRRGGFNAGGRGLYLYAFGFMVPAVVGEAIAQMMAGQLFDDDDDDGYLDNALSVFFGGQARMATAMVPLVGQPVQAGINQFNNKWYDDRISTSPAISALEATARVPYDLYRLASEEDARLKRPIQDVFTAIGLVTGFPVAPLARPIGYATDLQQGVIEEPGNPAEMARGLITGKAPQ